MWMGWCGYEKQQPAASGGLFIKSRAGLRAQSGGEREAKACC